MISSSNPRCWLIGDLPCLMIEGQTKAEPPGDSTTADGVPDRSIIPVAALPLTSATRQFRTLIKACTFAHLSLGPSYRRSRSRTKLQEVKQKIRIFPVFVRRFPYRNRGHGAV